MKWFFLFGLCMFFLFITGDNCRPYHFYQDIPKGGKEEVEISSFFKQTYRFLGEGSQIYAFVSEDGNTVLKLFKARHNAPYKCSRFLRNLLTKDWKQSKQKWQIKFQDTCRRYQMAFKDLREETGLIYLHFQKTAFPLIVTLLGTSKIQIDLSQLPFILQKKAILAPDYIRHHPEGIQSLKKFFITRTCKGYSDPRQTFSTNYGFLGDLVIQIDPGKIEIFSGEPQKEIDMIHARIDTWTLNLLHNLEQR